METGDRQTEDVGRSGRSDENVIRLPREWLGPLEDLVPIGPAADARRAAEGAYADEAPPTADAFWTEDAAALHTAVQAPAALTGSPPTAGRPGRRRHRIRVPAVHRTLPLSWARPPSRRALLAALAAAALVLAAIGTIEGGGHGIGAAPRSGAAHSGSDLAAVGEPSAANRKAHIMFARTSSRLRDARHSQHPSARQRNNGQSQGIKHRRPASDSAPTNARHASTTTVEPVSNAAVTPSAPQTYVPPATTQSSAVTPTADSPSSTGSGSSGSSDSAGSATSQPAFGADGALGPGSSPNS